MGEYTYFAFISYSSQDLAWGKSVQRKLEDYRMPAALCSERGWKRKPLNPIFFAPTDIKPGNLTAELQERLRRSRHLIVICSPHSAQSEWVGREIAFFHSLGRADNIHFFIVDGTPHSGNPETECFNPVLKQLNIPEILGANIHENIYRWKWLNRERAYVQLITKLLGVEFDSIWQRHRRRLVQRFVFTTLMVIGVLVGLICTWYVSQPVAVQIELTEARPAPATLPPMNGAVVTLRLKNETKSTTVSPGAHHAVINNVPRRMLGQNVRVSVTCQDFLNVDTTVVLQKRMDIRLQRDSLVYGLLNFTLWNEKLGQPLPDETLFIDGNAVKSDADGRVRLYIPLARQRTSYRVTAGMALQDSIVFMPHTESTAIRTK